MKEAEHIKEVAVLKQKIELMTLDLKEQKEREETLKR